jgi:hypothetical protein
MGFSQSFEFPIFQVGAGVYAKKSSLRHIWIVEFLFCCRGSCVIFVELGY